MHEPKPQHKTNNKQTQKTIRGKGTQMPNCLDSENADKTHITKIIVGKH